MRKLWIVLFLAAATAQAQTAEREIFPSDYKPQPCTATARCESFTSIDMASAAFKFLLRNLDAAWIAANDSTMREIVKPYCLKRASCLTVRGNESWFCNDVFAQGLRATCDVKYPDKKSQDNEQCRAWMDTFSIGIDQQGRKEWAAAQECMKKQPAPAAPGKIEWWQVPAIIPIGYTGNIQIYTVDADTHLPLMSNIRIADQTLYSSDVPTGRLTSYYTWKWPRKLVRVPNAQGHTDVVPPMMTISAEGHEPVHARVPTEVEKVNATISPAKLRAGVNKVTVAVTDAATGKPVDGQIYIGDETVGFANRSFELVLPKGKHADVWVRSPFDAYSDVVLVPAK